MTEYAWSKIAQVPGFIALVVAATVLELRGHKSDGLWAFIIFWAFFL